MIRQVCLYFALLMGINNLIAADLMEDDGQNSIIFSATMVNGKDDTSWRLFDPTVIDPNPSPDFCLIDPKSLQENIDLVKTNMPALFPIYARVSTDEQFAYFVWVLHASLDIDNNKDLKQKICLSLQKNESLYDYYKKNKEFKFSKALLEYAMKQRITYNEELKSLLRASSPKKIVYTAAQVEKSEKTLISDILMRIRASLMPASFSLPLIFNAKEVNGSQDTTWFLFDPYAIVDRNVPLLDPGSLKNVIQLQDGHLSSLVESLKNIKDQASGQSIAEIDQYIDIVFSSQQKKPYCLPSNKKQSLVEYVQLWKNAGYNNVIARVSFEYAITKCVMNNMQMRQKLSDSYPRPLVYKADDQEPINVDVKQIGNVLMQIREKIISMDSAARQDKNNNFASWYTIYNIKNPGYILFNYDRVNGKQDSSWLAFDPGVYTEENAQFCLLTHDIFQQAAQYPALKSFITKILNSGHDAVHNLDALHNYINQYPQLKTRFCKPLENKITPELYYKMWNTQYSLGIAPLEYAMTQKIMHHPGMKAQLINSYPQKIIYEVLETKGSEFNQLGMMLMRIREQLIDKKRYVPDQKEKNLTFKDRSLAGQKQSIFLVRDPKKQIKIPLSDQMSDQIKEIFTFNEKTVDGTENYSWRFFDPKIQMNRNILLLDPNKIQEIKSIQNLNRLTDQAAAQELMRIDKTIEAMDLNPEQRKNYFFAANKLMSFIDYGEKFIAAGYENLRTGPLEYALTKAVMTFPLVQKQLKDTYPAAIIYESDDKLLGQNQSNNTRGANEIGNILMRVREKIVNSVNSNPLKNVQKAALAVKRAMVPQSAWQRFLKIFTW